MGIKSFIMEFDLEEIFWFYLMDIINDVFIVQKRCLI
jgi:hypothetical protein